MRIDNKYRIKKIKINKRDISKPKSAKMKTFIKYIHRGDRIYKLKLYTKGGY